MSKLEIKLKFHNFKKIKNETFELEGSYLYLIKGKNDIGKDSFVQALLMMMTLDSKLIPEPIKRGTSNGFIEGTIPGPEGNYSIRVDMAPSGVTFLMFKPDGTTVRKVTEMRSVFEYNVPTVDNFIRDSYTPAGRRKQIKILSDLLNDVDKKEFNSLRESTTTGGKLFEDRKAIKFKCDYQDKLYSSTKLTPEENTFYSENNKVDNLIELIDKDINITNKIPSRDTSIRLIEDSYNPKIVAIQNDIKINEQSQIADDIELKRIIEEEARLKQLRIDIENRNRTIHIINKKQELRILINEKDSNIHAIPDTSNNENELKELIEEKESLLRIKDRIFKIKINNDKNEEYKTSLISLQKSLVVAENNLEDGRDKISELIKKINIPGYDVSIVDDVINIDGFVLDENQISGSKMMIAITAILAKTMSKAKILCVGKLAELDDVNQNKLAEIAKANDLIIIGDEVDNNYEDIFVQGYEDNVKIEQLSKSNNLTNNKEEL